MTDPDRRDHPAHCFCEIPEEELRKWAEKRYKERRSTMELLQSADNPREREVISIVALLDVSDAVVMNMMGPLERPDHHVLHCREDVKKLLRLPPTEDLV